MATERLPEADNVAFLVLSDWLSRAGTWRSPRVEWSLLVRRERLRLANADAQTRISAVQKLADYGRPANPHLDGVFESIASDADESVRQHAMLAAACCLEDKPLTIFLSTGYADSSAGVRREAVLSASARGLAVPASLLSDPAASVREAAAWTLGWRPTAEASPALIHLVAGENDPLARAMAVWAIGCQPTPPDGASAALIEAAKSGDPVLTSRVFVAAGRQRWAEVVEQILAGGPVPVGDAEPAAVYALGRCPELDPAVFVQGVLESGWDSGNGALITAACEALAVLGDRSVLPLMHDLAFEETDQPMVQYVAAASALALDPAVGAEALLHLLDHPSDVICDLAALRLAAATDPPVAALAELLVQGDERSRASAALALAFAGRADLAVEGRPLREWLADRTDPKSDRLEDQWKPHGYYLCARLVLGDRSVRDALDPFIRNASFPRIGLYAALLHAGDTLPMDLLLTRSGRLDVESFLRDARFIEIIRRHYPEAPTFDWFEDEPIRRWQTDRLREY
ncbi:MAG: HEAT repeat domain-containing protein, partial [Phycisphaerae bacterium]|nr:HEAT repeat domain-containing protein [Phycisphaerae bacterium]